MSARVTFDSPGSLPPEMKSTRPALSIVVPVFCGADRLDPLLERLETVAVELDAEIILVDDGSHDDTWRRMNRIIERGLNDERGVPICVVRLPAQAGQQVATLTGCALARGRRIATIDDDLEHAPEDLVRLVEKISQGYDLVYGVPVTRRYGTVRRTGSILFDFAFWIAIGKPRSIRLTSFRIMSDRLLKAMLSEPVRWVYVSALALAQAPAIGSISIETGSRSPSRHGILSLARLTVQVMLQYSRPGRALIRAGSPIRNRLPVSDIRGAFRLPEDLLKMSEPRMSDE